MQKIYKKSIRNKEKKKNFRKKKDRDNQSNAYKFG